MAIYKYTLLKYLKSYSTWIIILIDVGVIFGLVGGLAFGSIKPSTISSPSYEIIVKGSLAGMISMFALLGAIFVGYKGARMFKDEVEDGTFLIVLSKPQPRSRIIFQKWLAVFTMINIFMAFSVGSYATGVIVFDHPRVELESISAIHNLWKQSLILFGIGIVILLILSSIAIMVSTKISSGGTIGITTAIAIFIPITGFIGTFVDSTPYKRPTITTRSPGADKSQVVNFKKTLADTTNKPVSAFGWVDKLLGKFSKKVTDIYTNKNYGLGRIAFSTGEKDSYRYLSYIDLNYQLGQLGKIAIDVSSTKERISSSDLSLIMGKLPRLIEMPHALITGAKPSKVDQMLDDSMKQMKGWNTYYIPEIIGELKKMKVEKMMIMAVEKYLNANKPLDLQVTKILSLDVIKEYARKHRIKVNTVQNTKASSNASTNKTNIITINQDEKDIKLYLDAIAKAGKVDIITYVDYINKYWILLTYLLIAMTLMPMAYLVVKRQDFR